jgi:hypothetical protein
MAQRAPLIFGCEIKAQFPHSHPQSVEHSSNYNQQNLNLNK